MKKCRFFFRVNKINYSYSLIEQPQLICSNYELIFFRIYDNIVLHIINKLLKFFLT